MKQTGLLILLISNLLYVEVTSDDSFLQIENLEIYTANLLNVYNTTSINPELNTSTSIKNFFAKVNNFTNDLAENNVDLRFNSESISFSSYWEIPRQIHDDLDEILIEARNINEFFESYYIYFLDGFYTNRLIKHFIAITIYPVSDGLYNSTAKINDTIFSQQRLKANDTNFFDRISDKLNRNFNHLCESHSTRQQFLISLYSFIIKTQFRAFVMFTSAYKLNSILSNDSSSNFIMNVNHLRSNYLSTWNYYYLLKIKSALVSTSTKYYDCRPTHGYGYDINNVYAIDLSPTILDYQWNKVVTGAQLELRDGFLNLILYGGTLMENGKISTRSRGFEKKFPSQQRPVGYTFPKNRKFDYRLSNVEYVDKNFWKNISFLHTEVPENHLIIGANLEVLRFDPDRFNGKKVLYFRLHCAKVNISTGKIDTSNITYTKVWTKDDPELQQHSEINKTYSFKNNRHSIYHRILVNVSNSSTTERWRRRPPLNSYIDSNVIKVYPSLPVTSIGLWKNNYEESSNHLSLQISTIDISFRIKDGSKKND